MINEYFQFPSFAFAFALQTNPSNTQQRHNQSMKIVKFYQPQFHAPNCTLWIFTIPSLIYNPIMKCTCKLEPKPQTQLVRATVLPCLISGVLLCQGNNNKVSMINSEITHQHTIKVQVFCCTRVVSTLVLKFCIFVQCV